MKLTKKIIEEASANFLRLEELAFLYTKLIGEDWDIVLSPASLAKLENIGLMKGDKLTPSAEMILGRCLQESELPVKTEGKDPFDEIWLAFPKDDEYGNYPYSRDIRIKKSESRAEYLQAIKEISHEDMLKALLTEIQVRSRNSVKENQFKYMRSPINWFKLKTWEDYLDVEHKPIKDKYGKDLL